jgi:hypothetical protein
MDLNNVMLGTYKAISLGRMNVKGKKMMKNDKCKHVL